MASATSATLPHFVPAAGPATLPGMRLLTETAPAQARQREQALEQARREAVAAAEANFARVRAADRAEYEHLLATREKEHNERTAAALAERLVTGIAEIEQGLVAEVSRALRHFLAGAVRERALDELADTVKLLLVRKGGAQVRVGGPALLVDAMKVRLAETNASIAFEVETGPADVTVTLNETVIRTAVADWMARLSATTGGDGHG